MQKYEPHRQGPIPRSDALMEEYRTDRGNLYQSLSDVMSSSAEKIKDHVLTSAKATYGQRKRLLTILNQSSPRDLFSTPQIEIPDPLRVVRRI